MVSHSSLLLKCLAMLLAFAHLGTCAITQEDTRPRVNSPNGPPPAGVNTKRFESLYRYCVSRGPNCDCYEEPSTNPSGSMIITRPTAHRPLCDVAKLSDQRDQALQNNMRLCEERCMCYGGPPQNFYRWPLGPGFRDPRSGSWNGQKA